MSYVNMLKDYHVGDDTKPVLNHNTVTNDTCDETVNPGDDFVMNCYSCDIRVENADILSNLESKVSHLEPIQQSELFALFKGFEYLFSDEPEKTDLTCDDVDVG